MAGFKNRIFGQKVPNNIKKKFDDLQKSKKTVNPLDPLQPTEVSHHLGESLPFVRMWAAVDIRVSGSADEDSQIRVFSVNENREDNYDNNKPLSSLTTDEGSEKIKYVKQLSEKKVGLNTIDGNPYLKPAAGITSMTSKTEGSIGALQRTIVQFTVHNKQDFDNIFLPYFMRPGSTVCVDFGRTFDTNFQLYNPLEYLKNTDTEMLEFDDFIYNEKGGYLAQHFGYVKTTIGNVVKYDSTINDVGSFECSLEIVSRNTSLIDKKITVDSDLKYIFNNVFDELLISVLAAYNDPTNNIAAANIDQIYKRRDVYTEFDFDEEARKFFKNTKINAKTTGLISDYASQMGIFHQDLSNLSRGFDNTEAGKALRDSKEKTYITLGRLEDIFLNTFISGITKKDEQNRVFIKDRDNNYELQYDSRNGVCRWDVFLFEVQSAKLTPSDNLPSFILPNKWKDSYNSRLEGDYEPPDDGDFEFGGRFDAVDIQDKDHLIPESQETSTKDTRFPGIRVMPIRELFISTDLIKKAFSRADTIDKALQIILDQINFDSNNVWNLKLIATNQAKTNFCVHDCNLIGPRPDLVFDVTSDESIVSRCNLKFVEAQGGLASMIAISNQSNQTYIDQHYLGNLMHLNALNRPVLSENTSNENQFVRIKSLPFKGDFNRPNDQEGVSAIGVDRGELRNVILKPVKSDNLDLVDDDAWSNYINAKNKKLKETDNAKKELKKEAEGEKKETLFEKKVSDGTKLMKSHRRYLLHELRKRNFGKNDAGSVPPVLPLELELSIYGNDWLQIGDSFNINYLPKYYQNKVMFQIVGIEHKIDTNGWQTDYLSAMKLDPTFKSIATGKVHVDDPAQKPAVDDEVFNPGIDDATPEQTGVTAVLNKIIGNTESNEKIIKVRHSLSVDGTKPLEVVIGQPLSFDVYQRRYTKLTAKEYHGGGLSKREKAKILWYDTRIDEPKWLYYGENIAYSLALRQAMFELILPNVASVEFTGENWNSMEGEDWIRHVEGGYHNGHPLEAIVDLYDKGELQDIIELNDDEKRYTGWKPPFTDAIAGALVDIELPDGRRIKSSPEIGFDEREKNVIRTMNLVLKRKAIPKDRLKNVTSSPVFVDELDDLEIDDMDVPRLVRNYSFSLGGSDRHPEGGEEVYIFELRNEEIDIQKRIILPKSAFSYRQQSFSKFNANEPVFTVKDFINHINRNYVLFTSKDGVRTYTGRK